MCVRKKKAVRKILKNFLFFWKPQWYSNNLTENLFFLSEFNIHFPLYQNSICHNKMQSNWMLCNTIWHNTVNRIHLKNNTLLFSNQIATVISENRYLIISLCVDSCRADNEMSWLLANQQILWFTEFLDYLRAVCHISRYFFNEFFLHLPSSVFIVL